MNNATKTLDEVLKIVNMIKSGYATPVELEKALKLVKNFIFTEELFIRKSLKLLNPASPFKNYVVVSGLISKNASAQLDPWIELLSEYEKFTESKNLNIVKYNFI